MGISLLFNQASSIAQRNLSDTQLDVSSSMNKLSSGKRVVVAKDDAAAMAIGGRLNLQSRALQKIITNITQATSTVQIAEGAMVRVNSMLERMNELAVQAGAGNLSNTERGFLNVEYQQMKQEINRITASTKFNNNVLTDGKYVQTSNAGYFPSNSGFVDMAFGNIPLANPAATNGASINYRGNGSTGNFWFSHNGMSLSGAIDTSLLGIGTQMFNGTSVKLTGLGYNNPAGLNAQPPYVIINLDTRFNASQTLNDATATGTATGMISATVNLSGSNQTPLNFRVGASGVSVDTITTNFGGVNTSALGLDNSDISTADGAQAGAAATTNAVEVLLASRAYVGAQSSRLDMANQNQQVIIENVNASLSAYRDVDVAMELSKLAGLQILQTSGIAMLSQANQQPEKLMKLFQ
jgi:flagellin